MKKLILFVLIIVGCEKTVEPEDCSGVPGGTSVEDACGICGGDANFEDGCNVPDIDGNIYEAVQIGEQLWMAENLKVTKYNNGDDIPTGYSNEDWIELEKGAYAVYPADNDTSAQSTCVDNCADVYGNLYNWYAVDDTLGLCPEGWHVPTNEEWTTLTDYLSETAEAAGGKMKSTGTIEHDDGLWDYSWECSSENTTYMFIDGGETSCNNNCTESCIGQTEEATNKSRFTGLPAGYRSNSSEEYLAARGGYYNMGTKGSFWTSSEESIDSDSAWQWRLYYYGPNVGHEYYDKHFGFSIRCVAD